MGSMPDEKHVSATKGGIEPVTRWFNEKVWTLLSMTLAYLSVVDDAIDKVRSKMFERNSNCEPEFGDKMYT